LFDKIGVIRIYIFFIREVILEGFKLWTRDCGQSKRVDMFVVAVVTFATQGNQVVNFVVAALTQWSNMVGVQVICGSTISTLVAVSRQNNPPILLVCPILVFCHLSPLPLHRLAYLLILPFGLSRRVAQSEYQPASRAAGVEAEYANDDP